MSPSRAVRVRWWGTHVALPATFLASVALVLRSSPLDRASLEAFFDPAVRAFPLRSDWFFARVLRLGGTGAVVVCTAALAVGAMLSVRSARWREHSPRSAYLAVSVLATWTLAGLWEHFARRAAPWETIGYGGARPWPGSAEGDAAWSSFGSASAHAASGFAWSALYFVGASLGARHRWLWIAPGILLGLVLALGEHARGAHTPSDQAWSLALAWCVASGTAGVFRHLGWLAWDEVDDPPPTDVDRTRAALPWLVGVTVGFGGVAFYAVDVVTGQLEAAYPGLHLAFEIVELTLTALGFGIVAWLVTDKFLAMRARSSRRIAEERERRFQALGRLTAAVAHEVRNPLQAVRLIVDEQRHDVAGLRDHPLQPELEASIERIDRAVDLVYRLARPDGGEVEHADLAQAARESIATLSRLERNRVRFQWDHEPPRAIVASSRTALRIVLDNLLRNASQATPDDGTVRLELAPRPTGWRLRIRNPGTLSARASSGERGLGLGVPISRQIAANAGGGIDIEERGGVVTCTLYWPGENGGAA